MPLLALATPRSRLEPAEALRAIGVDPDKPDTIPLACGDATGGSRTELQAAVVGSHRAVDLPRAIEDSNYFANTARRTQSGDLPRRAMHRLERWLDHPDGTVWNHGWVRLPVGRLCAYAWGVLEGDLLAVKTDPGSGRRTDTERFFCDGGHTLRVPISYRLKLALADVIGNGSTKTPRVVAETGERLFDHFLSENTSPETVSFHIEPIAKQFDNGRALAREAAKRFLLAKSLIAYADSHAVIGSFDRESGLFAKGKFFA